jgi:hypothetical protein
MRINRSPYLLALGLAGTLWAGSAQANMEDMVACRNIHDDAARLACYDSAVEGVRAEMQARDEAQRAEIQEERDQRSFFGLPSFSWPGGARDPETSPDEFGDAALEQDRAREGRATESVDDDQQIDSITAGVVEWGRNPYGKTFVVLENGHVWRLTETRHLALRRNRDNVVHIRRGRMGSFFISANDVPAEFRVERVR